MLATSLSRALRATPRVRVNPALQAQSVRALATAVDATPENLKTFSVYRWVS